ncbi:MAG TPA: hypothetical protein PLX89_26160 [Verrucomicrobiota bacterium]|nr:hypothetical protein [Verrucomicrobiales bacterium]HRI16494.1 hypothetical protein [Verrucomicrobiota bacterium]
MNPTPPPAPQAEGWLFVAAAKGLQSYVLRSDPLKEMVGASELIESLHRTTQGGFLSNVISHLGFAQSYQLISDASGAVRIRFSDHQDALRLARLWPVLAGQFAPGLEISITVVEIGSQGIGAAIQTAERELHVNRNRPSADIPGAGPWVARNRRTGLPAARLVQALEEEERTSKTKDAVDSESARKREAASLTSLLQKVVPPEHHELLPRNANGRERRARWPLDLTQLATSDNSYVAIIHADANGLGAAMAACVHDLPNRRDPLKLYQALCRAIEESSVNAARTAMKEVIDATLESEEKPRPGGKNVVQPIPVRPIVCAGEDFTCVIRASRDKTHLKMIKFSIFCLNN